MTAANLADVRHVVLAAVVFALEWEAQAGEHGPHAEGLVFVEVEVDILEVDPLMEVAWHIELGDSALMWDLQVDVPVPACNEEEHVGQLGLSNAVHAQEVYVVKCDVLKKRTINMLFTMVFKSWRSCQNE